MEACIYVAADLPALIQETAVFRIHWKITFWTDFALDETINKMATGLNNKSIKLKYFSSAFVSDILKVVSDEFISLKSLFSRHV